MVTVIAQSQNEEDPSRCVGSTQRCVTTWLMWSGGEPFAIYRCANCTSTYCQWRNVTRHSVIIIRRIIMKALPGLTVAAQHLRAHHMELLPHMMYKTMLHRDCGQARYRTLYFCDHSLCIQIQRLYFFIFADEVII